MEPVDRHRLEADASFDGGDLDCGNGLLLLIRQHMDPLERGQLLEFRSTEISVEEDFPAWCRLTGNELVSLVRQGKERSFLVCKGKLAERPRPSRRARAQAVAPLARQPVTVTVPATLPRPAPAPDVRPLSVMGIGSWPRPRWMLQAIHEHLEGRLGEAEFQATGAKLNATYVYDQETGLKLFGKTAFFVRKGDGEFASFLRKGEAEVFAAKVSTKVISFEEAVAHALSESATD